MGQFSGRLVVRGLMAAVALAAVLPLAAQSPVGDWAQQSQNIDTRRTAAVAAEKRECERRDAALRSWARLQRDGKSKPDAIEGAKVTYLEAAIACQAARKTRAGADELWEKLNDDIGKPCGPGAAAACPQAQLAHEPFAPPASLQPGSTASGASKAAAPAAEPAPAAPAVTITLSPGPAPARIAAANTDAKKVPICSFEDSAPSIPRAKAARDGPEAKDFKDLMTKAAAARAKVNDLKKATGDAYAIGDAAAKVGLDAAAVAELRLKGNRASRQRALDVAEQGVVAFDAAQASRGKTGDALIASNTLVRCALRLAVCRLDGECQMTEKEAYDRAVAAGQQLDEALKAGENLIKSAKAESRKQDLAGLSPEQADRKNRYLDLLDKNPDAKALVGNDAASISASKGKTEGVLRLSLARLGFDNARRLSLQLSAPLNDDEATVAESRADRLSVRPNVKLAWSGVTLLDKPDALISYGLTATIGRASVPYIDATKPEKLELGTKPRGLGLTATLVRDERGLHTVGIERQRTWESGKAGVVCPLPAAGATSVRCLSGRLGVPTQLDATVSTYSYRRKTTFLGDALGLGIEATYNDKSREFDLGIPIYFIQGSGDTKNELNAGIRIGLVNKRDPANGRDTSIGLFVSSPFKLGGD